MRGRGGHDGNVIPAEAGIQAPVSASARIAAWAPACAGATM